MEDREHGDPAARVYGLPEQTEATWLTSPTSALEYNPDDLFAVRPPFTTLHVALYEQARTAPAGTFAVARLDDGRFAGRPGKS